MNLITFNILNIFFTRKLIPCSSNNGCYGVYLRYFTLCPMPCMPSVISWWISGAHHPVSCVPGPSSFSSQHLSRWAQETSVTVRCLLSSIINTVEPRFSTNLFNTFFLTRDHKLGIVFQFNTVFFNLARTPAKKCKQHPPATPLPA